MKTRSEYQPYARQLADLMGLRDWEILVETDKPPDNTDLAQTRMVYGRRVARIKLSADFLVDTPANQRATMVHELLHPHFMAMDGILSDLITDEIQQRIYTRMFEYGIDAVAVAWAASLPLPTQVSGLDATPRPGDPRHC